MQGDRMRESMQMTPSHKVTAEAQVWLDEDPLEVIETEQEVDVKEELSKR